MDLEGTVLKELLVPHVPCHDHDGPTPVADVLAGNRDRFKGHVTVAIETYSYMGKGVEAKLFHEGNFSEYSTWDHSEDVPVDSEHALVVPALVESPVVAWDGL